MMILMMKVEQCCWMTYTRHRETQATLSVLENLDSIELDRRSEEEEARMFGYEEQFHRGIILIFCTRFRTFLDLGTLTWWMRVKPKIWLIFDEPKSSKSARLLHLISMLFALLSILSMTLRTLPALKVPHLFSRSVQSNGISGPNGTMLFPPQLELENMVDMETFEIIDITCNIFFTLEFLTRLLCCPSKRDFVLRSVNLIDLIALISFYADLTIWILDT